ncbi:MAG: sugar phosphate isomerase/epimerase [Verrucomicrobia bacterium]|nr:sugar phosphate isomerase/epimerase [Verrucomicrobiota bacterium]
MTSRRQFIAQGAAASASLLVSPLRAADAKDAVTLGFSLYGMKSLPLDKALRACADIGFQSVELALMPGYATEPRQLSAEARRELRSQLASLGLKLGGLMENLPILGDDKAHAQNLDRLKAAAELAHALAPDAPPPLETVLGGKPEAWDSVKETIAARLRAWAEVAAANKLVLAIKAHVSNAAHRPEHALWLHEQVRSPWLKLVYDFSHFQLRGLGLADTMKAILPQAVFIHVKDARGEAAKFNFLLPGEGATDYAEYFRLLKQSGWRGPVVVEVSGQVFNKPGYDALDAARRSFAALAPAMQQAGFTFRRG